LNRQAKVVENIGFAIAHKTGWEYIGIDLSPAPLRDISIGGAIEDLAKRPCGASGTWQSRRRPPPSSRPLSSSTRVTPVSCCQVLEDKRPAQRWSERRISLDALLASSACGTGLDVVTIARGHQWSRLGANNRRCSQPVGKVAQATVRPTAARFREESRGPHWFRQSI